MDKINRFNQSIRHERGLIEKRKGISCSEKETRMGNKERTYMIKIYALMKMS